MILSIAILAVSLSLDALGVGVAYGLRKIIIPWGSKLVICLFSIFYSGAALAAGSSLATILPPYIAKLAGILILLFMGIWILVQALLRSEKEEEEEKQKGRGNETLFQFAVKSLGITVQVIRNPAQGDIDRSGTIDTVESLVLGLALSIDAIGAGIGSALAGFSSFLLPLAVGLFQLVFLYAGTCLAGKFFLLHRPNKKLLSLLPGALLIFLALMRIY